MTAAKIATLYLPYDVKIPTDAKAYYCSSKETGKIKLTELTNVIPAKTPVIVTSSGAADFNFQSNGEITATPTGMNGVLKGTTTDMTSNVANNYLTLGMKSGTDASPVYGFYTFTGDKIAANTCYMDKPTSTGSAKGFTLSFDGGTTGIDAITDQTAADVNGAMKVYYDLQGRRVQNPTKGIYIVNGKKIVINQ